MTRFTLGSLGALVALLLATTSVPARAADTGTAGPRLTIDGVRDTGQFLPDTAQLGRVNGKPITVRDFVESYFNAYAPDRPAADNAGRLEWLNSMVNKEILARVARKVNYQPDFAERATLRAYEQRVLSNTLFQRHVLDSLQVSDAEVRSLFEHTQREYHLQHVVCVARSTADTVYQALKAGRLAWKDAVKRFSVAKNDSGPDGDVGWVSLIPMSAEMTVGVVGLAPGEISPPVGDKDGWHILRLVESRPGPKLEFSVIRGSMASKLKMIQRNEHAEHLNARLREAAGLTYDESNIAWACRSFKPTRTAEDVGGVVNIRFNLHLPVFEPADTGRVLARYKDGTLTLSRFVKELGEISSTHRPSVDTPDAFRDEVDAIVLEPYRANLAKQMGLDRDPLAISLMQKRIEQMQVEHLYQDSIEARVRTTPAEMRRYYDTHQAAFTTYPTAKYAMFLLPNRQGADSMVAVLKGGNVDVQDLVNRAPEIGGKRGAAIHEEREQDHGTYHAVLFEELKPGQSYVDGPDQLGQFMLIHLISFDPGHLLSFADARGYADEAVRAEKSEAMLNAFLKRHRRGMAITLYPERVAHVRMLDPAAQPQQD